MANTVLSKLRSKLRSEMKLDKLWRVWNDEECNDAIWEWILELQTYWNFKWQENRVFYPTFSSVIAQQAYTLPTDFQSVDQVKYDDRILESADFIELNAFYTTFPSWTPWNYSIFEWELQLTAIPNAIQDIDLIYRKFLTIPTTDSELSPFPFNFDRAIILFAAYTLLCQPWDNKNFNRATIKFDKRYKREAWKLFNTYLLPDRNQLRYKTNYQSRAHRYQTRKRTIIL